MAYERYGVFCFALNDSLMNGNIELLSGFCESIVSKQMDIHWWGMARVDYHMTQGFIEKLIRSGCQHIAYGIESGSQRVLNLMRKGYVVSLIDRVLLNTVRAGIKPGINIMVGYPGEEEGDFLETCEFIKRNSENISYVNVTTLGIEPYSEVFLKRAQRGIHFNACTDWEALQADGRNTFAVRVERAQRLRNIIDHYVNKPVDTG